MSMPVDGISPVDFRCSCATERDPLLEEKTAKAINQLALGPRRPGLETHKAISKLTKQEALGSWVTEEYRLIWL